MKRIFLSLAAAALCSAAQLRAEEKQPANQNAGDSVRMYRLQEVEVTATRATPTTPVAYSDIRREEIARNSYGTDIPTLLALTPSMIATNETGIGIGGTAVRLRGTDPTRLNVTINGVAMNNPDSHSMYWYDTPDLVSAVGSIQVQRGAGICTVRSTPERERACMTFLKWLTAPKRNVDFVTQLGYMPVTQTAFTNELPNAVRTLDDPMYISLYQAFLDTQSGYTFYTPPQRRDYLELETRFEEQVRLQLTAGRVLCEQQGDGAREGLIWSTLDQFEKTYVR